jgi:hypothetical protein
LYLLELGQDATTTAHAESRAKMVKDAARGRAHYDVLQRGANAVLSGRPTDSVLAQVEMAVEAFHEAATA